MTNISQENIDRKLCVKPANFAKDKNISRQMVYKAMNTDLIDYVEIDGDRYIYLTPKTKNYFPK